MKRPHLLPWVVVLTTCALVWLATLYQPAKADPPINAQTVSSCGTPNNAAIVGVTYPVTMDQTAKLCVGSVNPSVGANGSTAPTQSTQVGIQVGGNLQAVSSGNPLPVSGSLTLSGSTNNIGNVGVNQGSATAGEIGPLVQCAATTSAPTYTTGTTNPLSCDLSGNLRTSGGGGGGGGAVYGPTATGSAPANPPVLVAGWDATNLHTLLTDTSGRVVVTGAYAIGSAAPSSAIAPAIVASDGTNSRLIHTDTSGNLVLQGNASAGMSTSSALVANNTTSVAIDASPGTLYAIRVFNNSATIAYLKLYNAARGSTTCGSGTPVMRIMIPASTSGAGAVINVGGGLGVAFSTAITRCVTTGIGDADTTAPAANTYIVEADYK